ncbi:MAG: conserved hypothetical protein [Candidatus Desulfovibrio kirbyi]|jgi:hypothetical protein|uniref:Lipoprotein n=1 Tax=Candidatus Desulfovibrio kirbyi TaxID=2696086 RepID=A0A6L2R4B0_9BACT|nr:hypothetical protein [Desulfovibrio sp.]GFH62294.1 MAG: conserved hypothetical protein [Candidatus Desulfovibrio kirbyi]
MIKRVSILCVSVIFLSACQPSIPKDALLLTPESLSNRQLQTRRFETNSNQTMLSSAAAVMQDLGFTLEESESTLGILVGSKQRDATSGGQIAGAVLIALLGGTPPPLDEEQRIRVSMVMREITPSPSAEEPQKEVTPPTKPIRTDKVPVILQAKPIQTADIKTSGQSIVRVTFQRIIINTAGHVTLAEQINDPDVYKEFFDKLSQSVFLEAHEI